MLRSLLTFVPGLGVSAILGGCGAVVSDSPDAGTAVDASAIDALVVDASNPACGDGRRDPGEVCFGTPIIITGNDVTYDGHLADLDGDGDLDLVYLIGDQYKFHPQNQGQFAATGLDGPTTFARHAVSIDLGGSERVELIDAGDQGISTWGIGANGYVLLGQSPQSSPVTAMTVANVTGGAAPNVVAIYGNSLVLGTYGADLRLTAINAASPVGGRDVTAGRLDSDALADVVVAGGQGVLVYRGMPSGLGSTINTPQQTETDAVAIGDIDNDRIADIVFAVRGASGQLGVMRGAGGAAYLAPTTTTVADLAKVLDSADIDGDGRADVIAARVATGTNAVLVALGQADGTLGEPVALPIASVVSYLRADADFNGDGAPDLVTTDINTQTMVILPSNP